MDQDGVTNAGSTPSDSGERNGPTASAEGSMPHPPGLRGSRGRLILLIGALAIIAALAVVAVVLLWPESEPQPPTFEIVIVPPRDGSSHLAIPGREVLLKAVVRPTTEAPLTWRWDFGDGSEPTSGKVTDPYNLGAQHAYADAKVGDEFTATLTVTDSATNETASDSFRIRFAEPTVANRKRVAVADGLWALHVSMKRSDAKAGAQTGSWKGRYSVGITAICAHSFELMGHDLAGDERVDPYVEDVRRALAFLAAQLQCHEIGEQPAGPADSNGNGKGLTLPGAPRAMYEVPLVAMAFASSKAPDRVVQSGHAGVEGLTYRQVVEDLVDLMAWGQSERGYARGGWRYGPNWNDADMSVTQWPVQAFMATDVELGIRAPDWVKRELLNYYLKRSQADDGSFGYRFPKGGVTTATTAAGIICLSYCGVDARDPRVIKAAEAIGRHWSRSHLGNYYAMYCVMKAAVIARPKIDRFGTHDWRVEFSRNLLDKQEPDGRWPPDKHHTGHAMLATALAILTLEEKVVLDPIPKPPAQPPPASPSVDWLALVLGTLALVAAALCIYFLHRRRRRARQAAPTGKGR